MKADKDLSGRFHRIVRVSGGLYGIETVVVEKGKIVSTEVIDENYPTVTLAKFGRNAFAEAQTHYDIGTQV